MNQINHPRLESPTSAQLEVSPNVPGDVGELTREQVLARVGREMNRHTDRVRLMRDAAALLADTLGLEICGFAMPVSGTSDFSMRLCPAANALDSDDAVGEFEIELSAEAEVSMLQYAISTRQTTIASDLPKEKRFRDATLLGERVHCGIAAPLLFGDRVVGAIAALSAEPVPIAPGDVAFVDTIAHLLAATVARYDAEDNLSRERHLRKAMLDNMDAIVMELTLDGEIVSLNPATLRIAGFTAEELIGRTFLSALMIPEEAELVDAKFDALLGGQEEQGFCGHLLDKEGERQPVRWKFTLVESGNGPLLAVSGTDLSETLALKQELDRSQGAHREAQRELKRAHREIEKAQLAASVERTQPFGLIREGKHGERRQRARRLYPYVQRIAPIVDGRIPSYDDFMEVRCRDIAAGGFSFLLYEPPQQKQYVAAFGVAPTLTYLTACVAHTTKLEIDGKLTYIVGCEYTDRVAI